MTTSEGYEIQVLEKMYDLHDRSRVSLDAQVSILATLSLAAAIREQTEAMPKSPHYYTAAEVNARLSKE